MHYYYCVECGIDFKDLRGYSFYELEIISERNKLQDHKEWDKVRHIMYAAGNWPRTYTPKKVLKLPLDDGNGLHTVSKDRALEIAKMLKPFLPKKK